MNCLRWICRLFGFLMILAIYCMVVYNPSASHTVGDNTDMIVFVDLMGDENRPYQQAYKIEDRAFIERMRKALQEDLRRPEKNWRQRMGLGASHALVLRDKDGKTTEFDILGNTFLVVEKIRYPAQRTMEVLRAARADGAAHAISADEARPLVPSWCLHKLR
jgi:hypothetical protein